MNNVQRIEPQEVVPSMDPMIHMIERVAMSPDLPIERLERMMDLKDRHENGLRKEREEDARRAFNSAMAKAQASMPTVAKSKTNSHTRSTYADLSDIEEQAMPVAYRNGFSVSFVPGGTDEGGNLVINWHLMHSDGHTLAGKAAFPLDGAGAQGKANKTGIQAMGSTMTYARRYLLCNLFNIATDDDTDGNARPQHSTITAEQFRELRQLAEQAGTPEETIALAAGVEQMHDLPAHLLEQVMKKLRNKIAAHGVQ